ncbi:MAG: alkaline phosphatase family protein [Planctomycetota bacterium]
MAPRRVSLAFLIDALGWEYVEPDGFASELSQCRVPLRTVLGYSSAAIPSILSGLRPAQSGHWNFFYYSPDTSPWRRYRSFLRLTPKWLLHLNSLACRLRPRLDRAAAKSESITGYFKSYEIALDRLPLFDTCERKSPFERKGLNAGQSIFDRLDAAGLSYCKYHYPSTDSDSIDACEKAIQDGHAPYHFLYLTEVDGFLHARCTDRAAVRERLRWYEAAIRRLVRVAEEAGAEEVHVSVFSDHGMTPVTKTADLKADLATLPLTPDRDYVAMLDSTMARFWIRSPHAAEPLRKLLESRDYGRLLSRSELEREGVRFDDERFGEWVFLTETGTILCPSDLGREAPDGMHGFDPEDRWSHGCFLANFQPSTPRHITDLHELMVREAEWAHDSTRPITREAPSLARPQRKEVRQ